MYCLTTDPSINRDFVSGSRLGWTQPTSFRTVPPRQLRALVVSSLRDLATYTTSFQFPDFSPQQFVGNDDSTVRFLEQPEKLGQVENNSVVDCMPPTQFHKKEEQVDRRLPQKLKPLYDNPFLYQCMSVGSRHELRCVSRETKPREY